VNVGGSGVNVGGSGVDVGCSGVNASRDVFTGAVRCGLLSVETGVGERIGGWRGCDAETAQ